MFSVSFLIIIMRQDENISQIYFDQKVNKYHEFFKAVDCGSDIGK